MKPIEAKAIMESYNIPPDVYAAALASRYAEERLEQLIPYLAALPRRERWLQRELAEIIHTSRPNVTRAIARMKRTKRGQILLQLLTIDEQEAH